MEDIIFLVPREPEEYKASFYKQLSLQLEKIDFRIWTFSQKKEVFSFLKDNVGVIAVIFDYDVFDIDLASSISKFNARLPVMIVGKKDKITDLDVDEIKTNIGFLSYRYESISENLSKIKEAVEVYTRTLLPPFTRELFHYAKENVYTFCTPGHLGGTAFQKRTVSKLFYDFYGPNVFKADLSISVPQLGSLLDHSGPHRDAEILAAEVFNSDKTFFVTNGTSTSNKIVGMYAATKGDVVLVDRNCHKSLTHLLMMVDVLPIYLKPTRNAYGILGGIPKLEFKKETIEEKIKKVGASKWPVYAVVTNSTYDGLLYNVKELKKELDVKHLHFDSAWIPYANFHPIYHDKYGMCGDAPKNKTIYETQSTHKLLAAFSQASMIHIKGEYDYDVFNECFMMHTSTSPQYSIVASCEISAAMMAGKEGKKLMDDAIEEAMSFRLEIKRIKKRIKGWFFDVWQPDGITHADCWSLKPSEKWHGFKRIDQNHLFLDPIKVTLLSPGIVEEKMADFGIPSAIIAEYLNHHGIVVEKTGPYSMLFLFSIGIDHAKVMTLIKKLYDFKEGYDKNLTVKEMLPDIYAKHPDAYTDMKIQTLAASIHRLFKKYHLPQLMFNAYERLPTFEITPHQAYIQLIKGKVKSVQLKELKGKISAVMLLPYPPGIPLIMPGEKVTDESKEVLDYLLMLEVIGRQFPGFEPDIHGVNIDHNKNIYVKVVE